MKTEEAEHVTVVAPVNPNIAVFIILDHWEGATLRSFMRKWIKEIKLDFQLICSQGTMYKNSYK